ncbi:MAG TPA: VWA domain-containing protein [Candidatus Nitrosopolaris sp.]|nr:VWA domain-containing protein [Candidatus Nitrosopolaris sp.]
MAPSSRRSDPRLYTKKFVYFAAENLENKDQTLHGEKNLANDLFDKMLKIIGREVLREKTPTIQDLERSLQDISVQEQQQHEQRESTGNKTARGQEAEIKADGIPVSGTSIVAQLIEKGYLKDSNKWLTSKGFLNIGGKILSDVMRALKAGDLGMHETTSLGRGGMVLDSTRRYERGDDSRLVNIPKSLLNTVHRLAKNGSSLKIPFDLEEEDLEGYETLQDVRAAIVYCIDLSSTMRYSSMFGDMSRIEAAKRALWSLVLLNQKFFPSDSVFIVGFGALASKVALNDIPYLKTFEPGSDFLHYTNYQSAFRLASKILQKNGALNKRIVLITDGHPSACFIDDKKEQDKILSQKPYSHFYLPGKEALDFNLDFAVGQLVYLCYRYKQVDQYIGEKTILEARRCHLMGIEIDTVMISEEDSLLRYVNEMERYVKGRSYYISPTTIDKALLTDYLNNKKRTIRSRS